MKYLAVHLLFAFKLFMYHLIVKASYHFAYAHGLMHGFMAIVIGALIVTVASLLVWHHHRSNRGHKRSQY